MSCLLSLSSFLSPRCRLSLSPFLRPPSPHRPDFPRSLGETSNRTKSCERQRKERSLPSSLPLPSAIDAQSTAHKHTHLFQYSVPLLSPDGPQPILVADVGVELDLERFLGPLEALLPSALLVLFASRRHSRCYFSVGVGVAVTVTALVTIAEVFFRGDFDWPIHVYKFRLFEMRKREKEKKNGTGKVSTSGRFLKI